MDYKTKYKTKYIVTDFGHLAYHYCGNADSSTAYIFIHGHFHPSLENQSSAVFDKVEDSIFKILLDSRGHGSSTRLKEYPSLGERIEDIDILFVHIVKNYPSLKEFHLVGYSISGAVVLKSVKKLEKKYKNFKFSITLVAPLMKLSKHKKWFKKDIKNLSSTGENQITKKYKTKGLYDYSKRYFEELTSKFYLNNNRKWNSPIKILLGKNDTRVSTTEIERFVIRVKAEIVFNADQEFTHYLSAEEFAEIGKSL